MSRHLDKEIICPCGETFIWSVGEQEFIQNLFEKGSIDKVSQPKWCPPCRVKKKEERALLEQNKKEEY